MSGVVTKVYHRIAGVTVVQYIPIQERKYPPAVFKCQNGQIRFVDTRMVVIRTFSIGGPDELTALHSDRTTGFRRDSGLAR